MDGAERLLAWRLLWCRVKHSYLPAAVLLYPNTREAESAGEGLIKFCDYRGGFPIHDGRVSTKDAHHRNVDEVEGLVLNVFGDHGLDGLPLGHDRAVRSNGEIIVRCV